MKINKNLIQLLKSSGLDPNDVIPYLLGLYFGYVSTYTPEELKVRVNILKIVEHSETGLVWNLPIFDGMVSDPFDWIKEEYISLFKAIGKGGNLRDTTVRMKKLFAENPDYRKDEIIEATKLYISNTEPKYVRLPHYFIRKGDGVNVTQDICIWIEKYRQSQGVAPTANHNRLR